MERERLDVTMVKRGLVDSRERAKQLIEAGNVQLRGEVATRPSLAVGEGDSIVLLENLRYVSRGGRKLEAALSEFGLDVRGLTALDVGASTGGFTDCLLQYGASRVYAVDIGHDQISPKIRNDPRVQVLEDTDIRQLGQLPEMVDLVVVDVSFISLRLVLPTVVRFLKPDAGRVVALIKPQYETGDRRVVRKGIIRSQSLRRRIVEELLAWIQQQGWSIWGLIQSPVQGRDGNIEYLAYLSATEVPCVTSDLKGIINELFGQTN